MSEYVIVRINEELIPDYQIKLNTQGKQLEMSPVTSWAQIEKNSKELILILAAHCVYNTKVKIPSKSEEVIRQSLPFALEEEISNNIEDNHYAFTQENEKLVVSVVSKKIIEGVTNELKKHGLKCTQIYSEIYTVPSTENAISFCEFESYYIVNKQNQGTCVDKQMLENYVQLQKNQQIILFTDKSQEAKNTSKFIIKKHNIALLQATNLLASIKHKKAINIFQGQYSKSKDNKNNKPNSNTTRFAVIALIVSWLMINIYQLWQSNNEINNLNNKQLDLLVKFIPNASLTERNDPFAAIQSRLKQTQTIKTSSESNGFITALYYIGATINKHQKIQVQSIRHRDNKLEVKLLAENVSYLNNFQSELIKNSLNMRVKTGTRESNKDGVLSVITMEKL